MARGSGPPPRWKVRTHGASKRRTWRKLHLALDQASGQIQAVALTTNAVSDADMLPSLLADMQGPISKLGADGAYDQVKVYDALVEQQIMPLIPPRINAVLWHDEANKELDHPRNEAIKAIDVIGLATWKQQTDYHRRSKAETGMFRWKTIFGAQLATRSLVHQQIEAQVKASCLNRMTQLGMPKTVRYNST